MLTLFASQDVAYVASNKGLDIVGDVTTALRKLPLTRNPIQSDDTSVLSKFKKIPSYKRVLFIQDKIDNIPKQTLEEIKKYTEAVNLPKNSYQIS